MSIKLFEIYFGKVAQKPIIIINIVKIIVIIIIIIIIDIIIITSVCLKKAEAIYELLNNIVIFHGPAVADKLRHRIP